MRRALRIVFLLVLATGVWLSAGGALAAAGLHIVVAESHGESLWLVREFIDDSLVGNAIGTADGRRMVHTSAELVAGSSSVSLLAAHVEPLIVFANEYVDPLEERLAEAERNRISLELEGEFARQLVGGLFQVPLWPLLAASEIPLRRIDVQRAYSLPAWRESYFPAISFAAGGNVPGWIVEEISAEGAVMAETGRGGEGAGLVLESLVEGEITDLRFRVVRGADTYALYVAGGGAWQPTGRDLPVMGSRELLGALEGRSLVSPGVSGRSETRITDSEGTLVRYLAAMPGSESQAGIFWEAAAFSGPSPSESPPGRPSTLPAILLCWLAFGLMVALGDRFHRFSDYGFGALTGRSLAIYPLWLLVALLASGLWGLGFIPASVLVSGLLAADGRRMRAFAVVLAAGFALVPVSSVIVNLLVFRL